MKEFKIPNGLTTAALMRQGEKLFLPAVTKLNLPIMLPKCPLTNLHVRKHTQCSHPTLTTLE